MAQRNHLLWTKSYNLKLSPQATQDIQEKLSTLVKPGNLTSIEIKDSHRKFTVIGPVKICTNNNKSLEECNKNLEDPVEPTLTNQSSQVIKDIKSELEDNFNTENDKLQQCRVCLNKGDIPIFGNQHLEDISDNLCSLAGIEIELDDEYPKYICKKCHNQLENALQFRKTARHSDMVLRRPKSEKDRFDNIDCLNNNASSGLKETNVSAGTVNTVSDRKKLENIFDITDEEDIFSDSTSSNKPKDVKNLTPVSKERICKICDTHFGTLKHYKEHMRIHKNTRIVCPKCKKSVQELRFHMHDKVCPAEKTYVCDICGKICAYNSFSNHRASHFLKFPFKCELCPYKCRTKSLINLHMRTHMDERLFQCEKCPKSFKTHTNLKFHSYTHKDTYDYVCDCGRGFHHITAYKVHKKVDHEGLKEHYCHLCQKVFGYRKNLTRHLTNVHKNEFKRMCPRGGKIPEYLLAEMKEKNEQFNSN